MIEEASEFDFENRIVSNEYDSGQDAEVENALRPKLLRNISGRKRLNRILRFT